MTRAPMRKPPRVCVVGSGAREHALALALAPDAEVVVAPGNPGVAGPRVSCSPRPPEDLEADLFVIGPEAPLVDGLADRLRARGALVFGPGRRGARLEGSKAWMKEVLVAAGVATARHATADNLDQVREWLRSNEPPYVIKTDGLAAGKGVLVTESPGEALADAEAKLSGEAFGAAGSRLVLEEGLSGTELSLLALCDGTRAEPLVPARDHKRLLDGDEGPNTGGMGAYSPVPEVPLSLVGRLMDEVVEPVVWALRRQDVDYRGVIYAGLMLTEGGFSVLELNVRFGDPEAQVVLARLEGGLFYLLSEAAAGHLASQPRFAPQASVAVVLASAGYPTAPRLGDIIDGVEDAAAIEGVEVLHAGTALDADANLVTAGGRVLDVVAIAPDLVQARQRAYAGVARLGWSGMQWRSDIAHPALSGSAAPGGR